MATKTCFECGETKPTDSFYPNKGHRDGLSSRCRSCTGIDMARRWRIKHPEGPAYTPPTEKACLGCGAVKPLDQFHRRRSARDGRQGRCGECLTHEMAEWNKQHPEYHRQKAREYHARHPDRTADNNLRWRLGVPRGTYTSMLEAQGGCCAICGATEPGPRLKRFHVDHCHDTNQLRALLCHTCNVGLGAFRDKSDLLRKAAEYLDGHSK